MQSGDSNLTYFYQLRKNKFGNKILDRDNFSPLFHLVEISSSELFFKITGDKING
jgi:hypothetical protein